MICSDAKTPTLTNPGIDRTMTIIAPGNNLFYSIVITSNFETFHVFPARVDGGGYYNNDRYYGRDNYNDYNYRGNGYDNLSPYYNDQFRDFGYNNYRCEFLAAMVQFPS